MAFWMKGEYISSTDTQHTKRYLESRAPRKDAALCSCSLRRSTYYGGSASDPRQAMFYKLSNRRYGVHR